MAAPGSSRSSCPASKDRSTHHGDGSADQNIRGQRSHGETKQTMNPSQRFPKLNVGRWTLDVGRFLLCPIAILAMVAASLIAQTEETTSGYGPPTSLPPNFTVTKPSARPKQNWIDQSQAAADAKSSGCIQCHAGVEPMHKASHVVLGCTDCHGGNPARNLKKEQAHILPRHREFWKTSANPPNSNVWLNHESPEFIRFMNPGH